MNQTTLLKTFPLTPMQKGMLYQWRLSKLSGVNLEQLVIELPERIDSQIIQKSWQKTILRFEALRTSIDWSKEGDPVQHIWSNAPLDFSQEDWQGLSEDELEARFQTFLRKDRESGFSLEAAPLMRVRLFQLNSDHFRIVWTFHHIILDGRSFPIVLKDLFKYYEGIQNQSKVTLPPSPSFKPYVDFLSNMDQESAKQFWQKLLQDVEEQELPFPHEDPRKSQHLESDQNELEGRISPNTVAMLHQFAEEHQLTFHTLLQAAWSLALSAYTGKTDVVFGTVRACRHLPIEGIDHMAGMLINTLPFRTKIQANLKFVDWLGQLRQQQIDVRPYEATPLSYIRDWVGIEPGVPLIRTMLMFDYRFLGSVLKKLGGKWQHRDFSLHEKTEFHLGLSAYLDEKLVLRLEYDSAVYDMEVCEDILGFMMYLLEEIPSFSSKKLGEIPTMPPKLKSDILRLMSPKKVFIKEIGLHQLFEKQVRQSPKAVALRSQDVSFTYEDLDREANRWAHYFISRHVKPGDILGVSMEKSTKLVVILLSILKTGAAYMPLDPNFPAERLLWMLEDAEPRFVVAEQSNLNALPLDDFDAVCVETVSELELTEDSNPGVEIDSESPAIIIFTSGSTGRPKGVLLPHRALINHNQAVRRMFELGINDAIPQMSTINFDVSIEEIFTALCSGACLVMPTQEARDSIAGFLSFLTKEALTVLNLTTLFWQEVVHHLVRKEQTFPDTVRLIIVGGERTTHTAFNEFLKVGGERIQWINAYGPSETCPMATAFEPTNVSISNLLAHDPPIGRPIDNTSCYVLDEIGRILPPGVPGELYIGGESVSSGYLKQPELTKTRFLPDPFRNEPGARMYKSGDRTSLSRDDGQLEYLDRYDNQIKMRGFRIELGEIETVLNRHESITEGIVQPVTGPSGQKMLVAYVVSSEGTALDTQPILTFLQMSLPSFMQPSICMPLAAFPKTPAGKINRKGLPQPQFQQTHPQQGANHLEDETVALILKHWQEVLGITNVSLQDNFFALGGNSLKAMTLATRIEEAFDRKIPLALLINAPTVEKYSQAIKQDIESEGFAPLIRIKEGKGQPLFLIHSLGGDILIYLKLTQKMTVANPIYGIQMQGLDRKKPPHRSLEACARDFLKLIKEVQPEGPYALAGYSSGGLIAFEMARQLHQADELVAFLGLIDSAIPPKTSDSTPPTKRQFMANFLMNLPAWAADISSWKPKRLLRAINRKVIQVAFNRRKVPTKSEVGQVEGFRLEDHFEADMSFFPAYRIELIRRHYGAISSYHPKAFPGSCCIFRSRRQPLFSPQNKSLGWNQLIDGRLNVHVVSGNHAQMLEEPFVQELAEKMVACWKME